MQKVGEMAVRDIRGVGAKGKRTLLLGEGAGESTSTEGGLLALGAI